MTNEAKFVLLQLYSIYLDRIEDGETKRSAAYFGNDKESFENYFLGFKFDDYLKSVFELKSEGFLIVAPGSNGFAVMLISEKGIMYSENETNKKYSNLLKLIKELKPLIF